MTPPSPVSPCPSKEHLTGGDRQTKSGPSTTPPNSGSSSSTASTPSPDKRTREQPNLSDCHCCGHRINHANLKDRLQPLDSVWRIVPLCRKCRKNVRSGQTCPYCFKLTGNSGDFVKCSVCKSRIHEGCVRDYENCTPWCYLRVGLGEFRTCMDCWVPDLLRNSIRVCGRSENKGVSGEDNGDSKYCLGKVMKNGKLKAEKKVKMAAKAKEQDLRKAMAAKKTLGMAITGKEDNGSRNVENFNSSNAIEISDTELAIQFCRVFNSTPRISKSEFFLNSSDLSVWKIQNWSGISYKRTGLGREHGNRQKMQSSSNENDISDVNEFKLGLLTYKRDKKRKIWKIDEKFEFHSDDAKTSCSTDVSDAIICVDANESGSLTGVNADQTSSCIKIDRFGQKLAIYKRTRFTKKGRVNGMVYVPGDNCEAEENLPNGSCNAEQDRYYLKYYKRVTSTKSVLSRLHSNTVRCEDQSSEPALSNSETDSSLKCDGELRLPNESSDAGIDRYSVKYVKRRKCSKSGSNSETELRSDSI